jgi:hypothetical protein
MKSFGLQDPQEDLRAGVCEESMGVVQRVSGNKKMEFVKRQGPPN